MIDSQPTAFVDESLRPGDCGFYVIAAVVLLDDIEGARSAAKKVPPSERRFHWSHEQQAQRSDMLDVLVGLGDGLWSYECRPCPTNKQERARAKCLEQLLWDVEQLGVRQLVIESRGAAADRKDRRTILRSVKCHLASQKLVYDHRRPTDDPGLWLADALAGTTAAALTGWPHYRARLGKTLDRRQVTL